MERIDKDSNEYKAKIELTTGGNYGYTFRIMPKHEMILDVQNLNLVKWITSETKENKSEPEDVSETEVKEDMSEAETKEN